MSMTIPEELEGILHSDPEILSGAVRFVGTQVPVQTLLDTLDTGGTLEEFYEGWPGVTREQAESVLLYKHNYLRKQFEIPLLDKIG